MFVTTARKSILFAAIALVMPCVAFAAGGTVVGDADISTDTEWTLEGSPYIVNRTSNPYFPDFLTITAGATLTIDPGVVVKFGDYNGINVSGTLRATGTAAAPVIFTSLQDDSVAGDSGGDGDATAPTDRQWMHIEFLSGSVGSFENAIVRYGGQTFIPVPMTGIANYGGALTIDKTTFAHNGYDGLGIYGGDTVLTDSDIYGHDVGITINSGNLTVRGTRIHNNAWSGIDLTWEGSLSISCSSIEHNGVGVRNMNSDQSVSADARGNWWGDASGPMDENNRPDATGDAVYGAVDYAGWLLADPLASDPCAVRKCASNVLFIPGLEASRLYRPDYAGGTDKLWEPASDADARDLFMDESGESVRHDIYAKGVVDEAYGTLNIYKSFLADLGEWKSSGVIADYGVAPYDWRVSLDDVLDYGNELSGGRIYYSGDLRATSTPYLIQELRRLAAGSQNGKVTIIAHSNGGLVAKALIKRLEDAHDPLLSKIDSLIMVAVPQAGTPQAVGALLHGYDQALPTELLSSFGMSALTARTLAHDMPSGYNLLPSNDYFTYVDDPVITISGDPLLAPWRSAYGSVIHSAERLRAFLTDSSRAVLPTTDALVAPPVANGALLARAEAEHVALDAWTPPSSMTIHEIAGWGEDTLATIRYYEGRKTVCADQSASTCPYYTTAPTLLYEPMEVVEGDGTVLVPSALWTSASTTRKYWLNLRDYGASGPLHSNVNRKHADIFEVSELRTFIRNVLTNATSTQYTFITATQPIADASDERLRFVLHSPLNLSATDNLGNVVSSATSTITGARWKRYGEVQTLTVPKNIPITLALSGLAAGSFTLDMQEIDGRDAIVASSTLSAVPSATSTRATMILSDGTLKGASPLTVDYDGDGATDFSLRPKLGGDVVFDTTPPEAAISIDPISQRLKIIGIDDTSSVAVSTATTSSIVSDEAGNTLEIVFKKHKPEKGELELEIQKLIYNGASYEPMQKNALHYEWSAERNGGIRMLDQEARAGSSKVEAHYDAKKNITRVEEKIDGKKETNKNLPGLVIIGLKTDRGKLIITY